MGQQSEIFARYRSLFNSKSAQPQQSAQSRSIDNMDFVDFLFELVKATKGQSQYKNIILKGSLSQMKKVDGINDVIKKALISKFGCDSNIIIRTEHTTKSTLGIQIDRSEIDAFGLLAMDPNTSPGRYMYEGNDVTKHVNFVLYKAQGVKSDNPLIFTYNSRTLFTIGSSSPNTFTFKFGEYYENMAFGVWLTDYLNAVSPIFNTVNFFAILTDLITGAISLKGNKSKDEIQQQSGIIKALQKLFGFCSEADDNSGSPNTSANDILNNSQGQNSGFNGDGFTGTPTGFGATLDNGGTLGGGNASTNGNSASGSTAPNPFDFNFQDLSEIENDANLRSRGVVSFATCGNLELDINPDDILSGLDALFASANTDELPYSYDGTTDQELPSTNNGTSQNGTNYDNSLIDPNANNASNFFDNALLQGAKNALNSGETTVVIDMANMNAELQLNILKAVPYALMEMVLSPKIFLIPKLHAVLSGDTSKKSPQELITSMGGLITSVGSSITSMLIHNIFDSIKSDLINLAKNLAVEFLKQRGLDYVATLSSLLSLLGLFSGSSSGCGGVLDKLLKLLKLANFGPMPMLPPPLILVGGVLKPGLNRVSIFNDIKSNLTEKGIETAPTLPDGTPNNMMIAIEVAVNVLITHIKTNSTIQTFGIGPTGPVQGYGQIQ